MRNIFCILSLLLLLSCSADSNSDGSTANQGQGGSLATFALKNDYLYTVDAYDLQVFSLKEPQHPVLVNKVAIGFDIETLFSYKDYLYIGSQRGMYIYDISNAEVPTKRSSVTHFTACDPVVANDTHAYVTLHSNSFCGNNINLLEIYDITDTTSPVLIHSRNLSAPKGLGLYKNYVIICDDEIKIFDISIPKKPTLVKAINKEAFDVIIKEDVLIAIGDGGIYQYQLEKNNQEFIYSALSEIHF